MRSIEDKGATITGKGDKKGGENFNIYKTIGKRTPDPGNA